MAGAELVAEAEDTVQVGFGGVEVVLGVFEGGKFLNREVFWKAFDGEAGKIVGHSMEALGLIHRVFIFVAGVAD